MRAVRRRLRGRVRRQLESPETDFDNGRALMLRSIDLLSQPQELYRLADDAGRRLLNKAVFDRLYIDHDGVLDTIVGDQLNEPFSTVVTYYRERREGQIYRRADAKKNGAQVSLSAVPADGSLVALLESALRDRSSSRAAMVELAGIEPAS